MGGGEGMRDTQYLWHLLQVAAQAALILVPQMRPPRLCNALFCCNRDAVKPLQALKYTRTYTHTHTYVRALNMCVCAKFVLRIRTSN